MSSNNKKHNTKNISDKKSKQDAEQQSFEERKKELMAKLVRPMGNPAELEQSLIEQTA